MVVSHDVTMKLSALTLLTLLCAGVRQSSADNLALGKTARQISKFFSGASAAVDGDVTSASWTRNESEPWWAVDLGQKYDVSHVNITTPSRNELLDGLDNFDVGLSNDFPTVGKAVNTSSYTLCGQYNGSVSVSETITVDCAELSQQFRYVVIRSSDAAAEMLCIAEVAVYRRTTATSATTISSPAATTANKATTTSTTTMSSTAATTTTTAAKTTSEIPLSTKPGCNLWSRKEDTASDNGKPYKPESEPAEPECMAACLKSSTCVGFDLTSDGCELHHDAQNLKTTHVKHGVTQFILNRHCLSTATTTDITTISSTAVTTTTTAATTKKMTPSSTSTKPAGCRADQFSCHNTGSCIPASRRCNGNNDCGDWSDEQYCGCRADQFSCHNTGSCIPASRRCNGNNDCGDWSDEQDCGCNKREFKCRNSIRCIPVSRVCDGINHCSDWSDEQECSCLASYLFKCANTDRCIRRDPYVCNGDNDCGDRSDELNCRQSTTTTTTTSTVTRTTTTHSGESDGLTARAKAAIAVMVTLLAIAIIIILVLVLYCTWRSHKRQEKLSRSERDDE